MSSRLNPRQEAKQRSKQLKDLWFMIRWLDEEDNVYDTICSNDISPPNGVDVLDISIDSLCKAKYQGKEYDVSVIATGTVNLYNCIKEVEGTYSEMKKKQKELERKEQDADGNENEMLKKDIGVTQSPKAKSRKRKAKPVPRSPAKKCTKNGAEDLVAKSKSAKKETTMKKTVQEKARKVENERATNEILSFDDAVQELERTNSSLIDTAITDDVFSDYPAQTSSSPYQPRVSGASAYSIPLTQNSPVSRLNSPVNTGYNLPQSSPFSSVHGCGIPPSQFSNPSSAFSPVHDSSPFSHPGSPFSHPNLSFIPPQDRYYSTPQPSNAGLYGSLIPSQSSALEQKMMQLADLVYNSVSGVNNQMQTMATQLSDIQKKLDKRRQRKDSLPSLERRLSDEVFERNFSVSPSPIGSPPGPSGVSPSPIGSPPGPSGDPHGTSEEKVFINEKTQIDVRSKDITSKTPSQLALRLLSLFFSQERLARSNCTEAEGRELLPQEIIDGIRLHVNYKFPLPTAKERTERWLDILYNKMNAKCRNCRAKLKKPTAATEE